MRHIPVVIPKDADAHIDADLGEAVLTMMKQNMFAELTSAADGHARWHWPRSSHRPSAVQSGVRDARSAIAREPLAGISNSLTLALRRSLSDDRQQAPPALELPTAAAVRSACSPARDPRP